MWERHASYSQNSLKGVIGDYLGEYYRVLKGDSRSLDCSSCVVGCEVGFALGWRCHGPHLGFSVEGAQAS